MGAVGGAGRKAGASIGWLGTLAGIGTPNGSEPCSGGEASGAAASAGIAGAA